MTISHGAGRVHPPKVELTALDYLNVALVHNSVPLVRELAISNPARAWPCGKAPAWRWAISVGSVQDHLAVEVRLQRPPSSSNRGKVRG